MKTLLAGSRIMRQILALFMLTALIMGIAQSALSAAYFAPPRAFANSAFEGVWQRADKPVAEQAAVRSWLWGEAPSTTTYEPYVQGAQGNRQVQYFDKSRMEINHPNADSTNPYYVTNGLLAVEMMSGQLQVGDAEFEPAWPADIPVAGDLDDPAQNAPTYAAMAKVASLHGENQAEPLAPGTPVVATINHVGETGAAGGPNSLAKVAAYSPETGHNIADVFWTFLNSEGSVYEGGKLVRAKLMDWFFVMGYPITEAYWTNIRVGGADRLVLVQAFQRRVLTYSPNNPDGWQVEMGNVGLHYYAWRYEQNTTGFVFINGKYIEPPYRIERKGADILINGVIVRSGDVRTDTLTPDPPPAQAKDAYDLVMIGNYRLWQLGVRITADLTPLIRSDLVSYLRSYPLTASVVESETAFKVTDALGGEALLLIPSVPPPSRDDVYVGLASQVSGWRTVLRHGGALLISDGVSVEVPAGRAQPFLESLLVAYGLSGTERRATFEEITGAPTLVDELVAAGMPPASLRARIPPRQVEPTPAPVWTSGRKAGSALFAPPLQGATISDTPKSDRAYLFSTLDYNDETWSIRDAAERHGYQVIHYKRTRTNVGPTISSFLATSGRAGILYVGSHGQSGSLGIEEYTDQAARDAAWQRYRALGMNYVREKTSTGHALAISAAQIGQGWSDANTIAQISACFSESLVGAFAAREYIGYPRELPNKEAGHHNSDFWGRVDGTVDKGDKRNIGDAFQASSLKTIGFTHYGYGRGRTVLSPGVVRFSPAFGTEVRVGDNIQVTIEFDTPMDTRWHPLIVTGCAATRLIESRWMNDHTYTYTFDTRELGQTLVGAMAFFTRSLSSQQYIFTSRFGMLDGSRNPAGTNHVGPNGDDFVWSIRCVGSGITPPTAQPPGTVTPPPTPPQVTATPPSPASPTIPPTSTMPPAATATPQGTSTATPSATASPTPSASPTNAVVPPTSTPQSTATRPASATPTPSGLFRGAYLNISITDPAQHATYYEVHFSDPALEELRELYTYTWRLVLPPGDQCARHPLETAETPWLTRWRHPDCEHSPDEQIVVIISRDGQSVQITGPAIGPAQATPTPTP